MKAAESLFEFMPYGAPELLQSRRERLASALLLSSLATAALLFAAGGIARLIVAPAIEIPPVVFRPHVIDPPPDWSLPRPPTVTPSVRPADVAGVPVPAAEPDVPLVKGAGPASDGGPAGPQVTGAGADDAIAPSAGAGLTP